MGRKVEGNMNWIDWNNNDPRYNNLFTDNMKLTKENKKLRDKVSRMESRLNEIESQLDEMEPITLDDENDFHLSDYDVPESNANIYIITALLVFFIVIMIISIINGSTAL